MTVERINDSDDPEVQADLATDLPGFIELPVPPEVQTMIAVEKDGRTQVGFVQAPGLAWDNPSEAYDSLSSDAQIEFDDSINRPEWGELIGAMFLGADQGDGTGRLLVSYTDQDKIYLLKQAMRQHQKLCEKYQQTPDDFYLAYNWLLGHPAFWYRREKDSDGPTLEWVTDDGFHNMWTMVDREEDGHIVVVLEHGSAVPPARTVHYHDPRLDVVAPSFEDAYIQLARQVDKFFNLDGTDKVIDSE